MPVGRGSLVNTYVCLLRSINVGIGRTIKMTRLQELFAAVGHPDVVTYIQSGNVIFRSPSTDVVALAGEIEGRIAWTFGFDVSAILRTGNDMTAVISANPFPGRGADPAKLHVTFLAEPADSALVSRITPSGFGPDDFVAVGREVYLYCPGGYGRTKLNNTFWERQLRVVATTRNWNTVNALCGLADD